MTHERLWDDMASAAPAAWTGTREEYRACLMSFAGEVLELFAKRADAAQRFNEDDASTRAFNRGVIAATQEVMSAVSLLHAPASSEALVHGKESGSRETSRIERSE
jgi:hypothetical protein